MVASGFGTAMTHSGQVGQQGTYMVVGSMGSMGPGSMMTAEALTARRERSAR